MNKKIGFAVASTLFLFVVLSTPLAFAQDWFTCTVNVQAEEYYFMQVGTPPVGDTFSFYVITPIAGTPNTIIASDGAHTYTINLVVGDFVEISLEGLTPDDVEFYESSGHLLYDGPADSITVNEVEIPEFPSFLILPLFMIATLLAAIVLRKKLTSQSQT